MGGFAIRIFPQKSTDAPVVEDDQAAMGGNVATSYIERHGLIEHLDGNKLLELIKIGWLPRSPMLSEEEIKDKAKSNALEKALLLFQLVTFSANVITRAIVKLPISLLELGTICYAALAMAALLLQFDKPRSVDTASILKTLYEDDPDFRAVRNILQAVSEHVQNNSQQKGVEVQISSSDTEPLTSSNNMELSSRHGTLSNEVPWSAAHATSEDREWLYGHKQPDMSLRRDFFGAIRRLTIGRSNALIISCYGGLHLAGWNFEFPTSVEMWMWRASCIILTSAMLLALFVHFITSGLFMSILGERTVMPLMTLWIIGLMPTILFGGVARLFLVAEMFRQLFYLPPGAFKSTWTDNIPSFS